ncbi:MAG TPA: PQQ-binding-like beta-propeller repeat protein [Clostridia bacterium]|nr:PQQ-binding-like beta-propeller repeat protein [Clostridia bacterium]
MFFSVFILASLLTLFGPKFSSKPVIRRTEPAGLEPTLVWSVTPWQGLWAEIAPRPWSRAAFEPVDPAVGEGVVVFIGTPGRADILDARTGRRELSFSLEHERLIRGDTARYVWERPVISGGHVILRQRSYPRIHLIDLGTGWTKTVEVDDICCVAPAGEKGFYVAGSRGVSLLDWEGEVVWRSRPAPRPPLKSLTEPVLFSVNEFADPALNPWLTVSRDGVIRLEPEGLYVCHPVTGEIKWHKEPVGRFLGMAVSPRGDAVYVVDVCDVDAFDAPSGGAASTKTRSGEVNVDSSDEVNVDSDEVNVDEMNVEVDDQNGYAKRVTAYSIDGVEMWSRELPAGCLGIVWTATPEGLVLASRFAQASSTESTTEMRSADYIGLDGSLKARIPIPEREPYSLQYQAGLIVVISSSSIFAYRSDNGNPVWRIDDRSNLPAPGGFGYRYHLSAVNDALIVPQWSGISAYDVASGSLRWSYSPPGGFLSAASCDGYLYVTSRRGIFALEDKLR